MSGAVSIRPLPWFTRLWFAVTCLLRILFDGAFAGRVWAVREGMPELPAPDSEPPDSEPPDSESPDSESPDSDDRGSEPPVSDAAASTSSAAGPPDVASALTLLSLLQQKGRLVDFLEQDIADFDDADIGAAARVVHEGCRKVLHAHGQVTTVRREQEEAKVEVTDGIDTGEIKLTGQVGAKPPYRGVLRHRGWRVAGLSLPQPLEGHDATVIAPAEVEL